MAVPYGKMIACSIVVSPDQRGQTVVETQKMAQVGRQLRKRGWTFLREIWLAPVGWKDTTTIIYPMKPVIGKVMFGFRFYDTQSERNIVICVNGKDERAKKATYPRIVGLEKSRKIAAVLTRKAFAAFPEGGSCRLCRTLPDATAGWTRKG